MSAVTASRHLALGTFATAGVALVPPALGALRRDHPELRLRVLDLEPPDGYGLVASGDLDLLITHRYPGMPSTPTRGLVRRDLLLDPLRLAEPGSATTEPGGAGVRLVELADRTWVSGSVGVPNPGLPGAPGATSRFHSPGSSTRPRTTPSPWPWSASA